MPPALVLWSGGKDAMLALHEVRARLDIAALVTTVTEGFERISMHGVRIELLRRQVDSLDLPLDLVRIPQTCTNAVYEEAMRSALARHFQEGPKTVVCGDLFLEDIRRYREERILPPGSGVFPLWGRSTKELADLILDLGFRAVLCCVDTTVLPPEFAGREFDRSLLADLPAGVDPCGENGELHTFVYDGPGFRNPVPFRLGERVLRDGRFAYVDLVPSE